MAAITTCLAINIRNLRQQKGFTQTQLAQKAGISLIFLQGIEGERKWISPGTAKSIAKALQVAESDLFSKREMESFARKSQFSTGQIKKRNETLFEALPADIAEALEDVCRHPEWKWETFRWILDGYRRHHRK